MYVFVLFLLRISSDRIIHRRALTTYNIDLSLHYNWEIGPSTEDLSTWSIIEKWVAKYLGSHERCGSRTANVTANAYRPTRLVQLGKSESGGTWRVVARTEVPNDAQYITLSHCWGKPSDTKPLQLETSNVKDFALARDMHELPKTFRDASKVSRRLGVRYMWIDRLCILQDSAADWNREASLMHQVYRHGLICVSALGASDSHGGLFLKRDPSTVWPNVVHMNRWKDDATPLKVQVSRGPSWQHHFQRDPLLRRAWVVQERLLAPRVLHFGSNQVYWECYHDECCEVLPLGVHGRGEAGFDKDDDPHKCHAHSSRLWKTQIDLLDRKVLPDLIEQLLSEWYDAARLYSACALTMPGDKLVALSGIANDMQQALQQIKPQSEHRYLAGMWEEQLEIALHWFPVNGAKRPRTYRAPSWSWAVIDGEVDMRSISHGEVVRYMDIIHAETSMAPGASETGKITGGSLQVTGPFCQILVGHGRYQKGNDERLGYIGKVTYERGDSDGGLRSFVNVDKTSKKRSREMGLPSVSFDTLGDVQSKVYQLMMEARPSSEVKSSGWNCSGLVLALVNEDSQTYRRVGKSWIKLSSKDDALDIFKLYARKKVTVI